MSFLKKSLDAFTSLFLIATITFMLLRFLPGGPFDEEVALSPEVKSALEAKYHLNESLWKQYFQFLGQMGRGDLGVSYKINQIPVTEVIADSVGPSMVLGGIGLAVTLSVGVLLGLLSGIYARRPLDRIIRAFISLIMSFPAFLSGPFLVLVFSFWLDWLPPALWNGPRYFVLPVLTLSLRPIALVSRLMRSSFLDSCNELFTKAAVAKGLAPVRVFGVHVLRNSLLPLLALLPTLVANMLSGSFVVESVFAIPGLGRHLVDSVTSRDFPLILGLTLFYSVLLIFANWVNEILFLLLDPRLRNEVEFKR